jgi:hypothetical protein
VPICDDRAIEEIDHRCDEGVPNKNAKPRDVPLASGRMSMTLVRRFTRPEDERVADGCDVPLASFLV